MSRLKKLAKPRTKKKEVVLTVKYTFEVFGDNEDETKIDCKRFKQWMKDHYTQWDSSILQYFLYAYNLMQDPDDAKYKLEFHIDKILKDDSATIDERNFFDKQLEEIKDNLEEGGDGDINTDDVDEDLRNFDKEVKENDEEDTNVQDEHRKE
jgi:hypothetical protein